MPPPPSVFALAPVTFVSRMLCRLTGCRWQERTGYDWCDRCQTAQWHLVRDRIAA